MDIVFKAYEVGTIINDARKTIIATHNFSIAKEIYKNTVSKYQNSKDHVIVFLYDYENGINKEYYDSETDIC